ncbi:MAG: glutamyl-tRNA reductase [Bacteroidota bacterium]
MKILAGIEITHETAPIELLETITMDQERFRLFKNAAHSKSIFVLSTCNRLACYSYVESTDIITDLLKSFFTRQEWSQIEKHLEYYGDSTTTVRNLFETASGLKSQIIGEAEILGQLKDTYKSFNDQPQIHPVLNEFLRESIRVGKKVRCETKISHQVTSIMSATVKVMYDHFTGLNGKKVMVIGTGNIARKLLAMIKKTEVSEILIASHSMERAYELSRNSSVKPIQLKEIHYHASEVDIFIGASNKQVDMITNPAGIEKCQKDQFGMFEGKERLFIDLGVPRNFNSILEVFKGVTLLRLEDINLLIESSLKHRNGEKVLAGKVIDREIEKYFTTLRNRELSGHYAAYNQMIKDHKEAELNWLLPKLGDINERQLELIKKFAHRLVSDITKVPYKEMRMSAGNGDLGKIQAFMELNNVKGSDAGLNISETKKYANEKIEDRIAAWEDNYPETIQG